MKDNFKNLFEMKRRNRVIYLCMIIIVIMSGIASRKFSYELPEFIAKYSGDTLWALMVFFIFGFVFLHFSTFRVALIALIFSLLIELSQLYHVQWINTIRNTKIGGLILGYGFLWSDLVCYTAGIIIGGFLEKLFINKIGQ